MSKRSKAKALVEYATARFVLSFLSFLPRRLAVALGCALGQITYGVSSKLRSTGERNLALAFPDMDASERSRILRGCFVSLGRQLGEVSHFAKMSPEGLRRIVECEGLETLERAQANGSGVILVTAHLGAWELSSFALSALGHPLSFLVRRIDNPRIEDVVEKIRTRFGNRTIDKRGGVRSMLRLLKAGGTLGLLVDVNMLAREGIFVDFFGVPASTTFTAAQLALRTKAAVVPVFVPWDPERRQYRLSIGAPLQIEPTADEKEDTLRLTSLLTEVIENNIRRYPDQWLWIHKRWRTRPPGEPDLYETVS